MSSDLALPTLRALRRILRVAEIGSRRLAGSTGLTPSQFLVLQEIARHSEVTPSAVAARLQFSQATITTLVTRLAGEGFVTRRRDDRDKRQMLLKATETGQALINQAPGMLQARFQTEYEQLATWEQAMILASLERIGQLLGADEIEAAPLIDGGEIDRASHKP